MNKETKQNKSTDLAVHNFITPLFWVLLFYFTYYPSNTQGCGSCWCNSGAHRLEFMPSRHDYLPQNPIIYFKESNSNLYTRYLSDRWALVYDNDTVKLLPKETYHSGVCYVTSFKPEKILQEYRTYELYFFGVTDSFLLKSDKETITEKDLRKYIEKKEWHTIGDKDSIPPVWEHQPNIVTWDFDDCCDFPYLIFDLPKSDDIQYMKVSIRPIGTDSVQTYIYESWERQVVYYTDPDSLNFDVADYLCFKVGGEPFSEIYTFRHGKMYEFEFTTIDLAGNATASTQKLTAVKN